MEQKFRYIAIDLKSFFASVECVERHLDPLTTNLVVADESRTDKTICLAVTPSLKKRGISGRARLFEVLQKVSRSEFIIAPPRMALYLDYSTRIYSIYLRHVAPADIHVYSIDEVFINVAPYLRVAKTDAYGFAEMLMAEVYHETGITATAGIGTNLYLCKVAMDIIAKHAQPNKHGARMGVLDELTYRKLLWNHKPLTDFWQIGHGIAQRLQPYGIDTMGKIARASLTHDEFFYKIFGIKAELIIDHAWGWEPCTMEAIKAYQPESHSISNGQVLTQPYTFQMARNVLKEMVDNICLDMVSKNLVTQKVTFGIGYDAENMRNPNIKQLYTGKVHTDHYGRLVPKHTQGTVHFLTHTSSAQKISKAVLNKYDELVNRSLYIRRLHIAVHDVVSQTELRKNTPCVQLELFPDPAQQQEEKRAQTESVIQKVVLNIKKKFGKNAILNGSNFAEGATARERNMQIGGHKA